MFCEQDVFLISNNSLVSTRLILQGSSLTHEGVLFLKIFATIYNSCSRQLVTGCFIFSTSIIKEFHFSKIFNCILISQPQKQIIILLNKFQAEFTMVIISTALITMKWILQSPYFRTDLRHRPVSLKLLLKFFIVVFQEFLLLLWLYLTNKYRIYIFHFSPIWSDIYQMGSCTYCIFFLMCNSN